MGCALGGDPGKPSFSTDAVVNLAGEPIAEGRWTEARKRVLVASRIVATRLVVTALAT